MTLPVARRAPSNLVRRFRKTWPLFVLVAPAVIYITIFAYGPMYGALIAFKDYSISKGILGSEWAGFQNFHKFFSFHNFWLLIRNTLRLSIYSMLAGFLVRLMLSLSLHCVRAKALKSIIQTITYMPHFISTVVMVGIIIRFFNPSLGAISRVIQAFGGTNRDLMGVDSAVPHIYVWSGIWQNAGWSTILFLATLTSVDIQLHEAAIVDGANRVSRLWHIDLPALVPTIVICLILDCGNVLNVGFEKILLMRNSLNNATTQVIATYMYDAGISASSPQYSYATAIGLFNSAVNFTLIISVNGICRRLNETSLF